MNHLQCTHCGQPFANINRLLLHRARVQVRTALTQADAAYNNGDKEAARDYIAQASFFSQAYEKLKARLAA